MHTHIGMLRTTFVLLIFATLGTAVQPTRATGAEQQQAAQGHDEYDRWQARRSMAERELQQLPQRVEAETARIMKSLDHLFRVELKPQFDDHHRAVQAAIKDVGLPAETGTLQVIWDQLKSPLAPQGLEGLAQEFVANAQRQTEPQRERLQDQVAQRVQQRLNDELAIAQEEIRNPMQEALGRHFPVWQYVPLPPPDLPSVDPTLAGPARVGTPLMFMTAILMIVLRRMIRRIVYKVTSKIAGRVLTKLIPIIGWVMLALTVWDAARARAQLEAEFRSSFLEVYQEEFTAQTVWETADGESQGSLRQTMNDTVSEQLQIWEQHCRAEAQRMLDAARALSVMANTREYLEQQRAAGRSTAEVSEELATLDDAFGRLLAQAAPEEFLIILSDWPDTHHAALRQLADEMGTGLLEHYRRYGRTFLVAAHRIGPRLFQELITTLPDADWREVAEAFTNYGSLLTTENQKRGLLLLVMRGAEHRGIRVEILEGIGRNLPLSHFIMASVEDESNVLNFFADNKALSVLDAMHAEDTELAQALLQRWPLPAWHRYHGNQAAAKALMAIAQYRTRERSQVTSDFADELAERDDLLPIYQDVGLEGLRIWDALVTSESGRHQRDLARRAIGLYKQGIPASRLQTEQDVAIASHFSNWPVVGPQLVEWAQRVGMIAYVLVYGMVAMVCVGVFMFLRRQRQPSHGRKK